MKSEDYRSRLSHVFDKTAMGNAIQCFPKEKGSVSSSVSDFFLQSLTDTSKIDAPSISNTLNFAQTWFALGKSLNQDVINQIFYIILKMPTFTPKFTILIKYMKNDGCLYNAISYCLRHDPKQIKESIAKDDPIWRVLLEKFNADFNEKKAESSKKYSERECHYLIEVFYYYWPLEKKSGTNILELVNAFFDFCKETRSVTSIQLLHLIIRIFPHDFKSSDFIGLRPKNDTTKEDDKKEMLKHIDPETGNFII